ncbi:NAD(P)H-binding protein [Rhizobium sp. YTU87027]|uniref:NAD(P)H-binding protein n=1 Tax=Rhizobium sp. YTU87027 TaxID=3417741 RepID=UPI003D68A3A0
MTRILVMGANGKTGRCVVEALSTREEAIVRCASRFETSASHATFDWELRQTWRPALEGIEALYLVKPASTETNPDVRDQMAALLDCAPELRRVVLLSEIDAGTRAEDLDERRVERLIENSSLEWTILRPHWFMQNFADPSFYLSQLKTEGRVSVPTGGHATSFVDTRDVGDVAAAALLDRSHAGKHYTLTGPASHTWADAMSMISFVSGRQFSYEDAPLEPYLAERASPYALRKFADHNRAVYEFLCSSASSAISEDVQQALGRPARTFETFVRETGPLWR